jgi:hypothetical protein
MPASPASASTYQTGSVASTIAAGGSVRNTGLRRSSDWASHSIRPSRAAPIDSGRGAP